MTQHNPWAFDCVKRVVGEPWQMGVQCPVCVRIEEACEVMHDAYERAAVAAGWATQTASRRPWADVPEANKATMRAAVGALLVWLDTADTRNVGVIGAPSSGVTTVVEAVPGA